MEEKINNMKQLKKYLLSEIEKDANDVYSLTQGLECMLGTEGSELEKAGAECYVARYKKAQRCLDNAELYRSLPGEENRFVEDIYRACQQLLSQGENYIRQNISGAFLKLDFIDESDD